MGRFSVGLVAGAAYLSLVALAPAATIISDGTFANVTVAGSYAGTGIGPTFVSDPGSTTTLNVCASCGNPGAALQYLFNATGSSAVPPINAGAGYIDNLLKYTPSVSGAITSINGTADKYIAIAGLSGSIANNFRILIEQNLLFYVAIVPNPGSFSIPGNSGWVGLTATGLNANNFSQVNFSNGATNSSSHPNFSVTGSQIRFGVEFLGIDVPGETSDVRYDNLNFTIAHTATPIPASLPLFASGLGALALLARRKRKFDLT